MRHGRRTLIIRLVVIGLLGGVLVALLCLPRELFSSAGVVVGAVAVEDGGVAREPGRPGAPERDQERPDPLDDQERRIAESIGRARESAVTLEYATAGGPSEARRVATGVVINASGEVLSIRIDPPPESAPVVARGADGHRHPADWLAADAETGLTLLRIAPGVARPIRAATRAARLGGQVLVIGNPFGLGHSVLRGHISGLDRRLELGPRQLGGLIQLAVALHPGDSGALVANLRGEWLGVIRSGLAQPAQRRTPHRDHDHDLGFAIPARDALWVADQLRTQGRVDRAYLGVRIDPADVADDPPGAVLLGVLDDSPAGRAGLQAGDRIIALNGHPIRSSGDLSDRLDHTLAGVEVVLDARCGDRIEHRTLRTISRPPSAPKPKPIPTPAPDSQAQANPATPASPRPDDLRLALPREVLDRLDRLERRLDALEKRTNPTP